MRILKKILSITNPNFLAASGLPLQIIQNILGLELNLPNWRLHNEA
jgi:hypothetical protein